MKVTTDTVLCNLCLDNVNTEKPLQAIYYCNNCNKNLCNVHLQAHNLEKSTKDHNLNPLLIIPNQQSLIENDKLQSLQNETQLLNNCNNDINNLYQINNENTINSLQNKKRKIENNYLNNNILQENTLQCNNITKINFTDIVFIVNSDEKDYFYNDDFENIQLIQFLKLKMKKSKSNFDLIKFKLISKFGGPIKGNGNDKLNYPFDIIYKNNLIYIADKYNKRILILDNLFNYKNEIKLNSYPISLAINSNNYLFIGCYNSIYKYNLNTLQLMNEIKNNENYKFNYIYGMTFDKVNNLYICNYKNKEIIILNENNEFIRKFKINLNPRRILINNKNQIVITCCDGEIKVYDKLGNFISNVKFNNSDLNGIINDKNDNYIICDLKNNKLLLLDNEFKLKKEFNENLNNSPFGITLNEENNQIYIVEHGGHCCKLFK